MISLKVNNTQRNMLSKKKVCKPLNVYIERSFKKKPIIGCVLNVMLSKQIKLLKY